MLVKKRFFTAFIVNGDEFQCLTWCERYPFLSQYFGQQCSEKFLRRASILQRWLHQRNSGNYLYIFCKQYVYSPLLAILKSTNEYGRFQLSILSYTRQLKYCFIRLNPFYNPVCHYKSVICNWNFLFHSIQYSESLKIRGIIMVHQIIIKIHFYNLVDRISIFWFNVVTVI